jgi:PIN domain nuclease of toxin-antitoxin system
MGSVNMYLLDTCTFYWLCSKPEKLPRPVARVINSNNESLHVSHVSFIELANIWLAGRMEAPTKPRQWLREQIAEWDVTIIRMDEEDIFRSTELPLYHRDPFDRLLIAQAIIRNYIFLTPDQTIHRYPVSTLW